MMMMKKTFFYNFFPTKSEEEASPKAAGQVSRVLVEARDVLPPPAADPANPWQIRKTLTQYEVITGMLVAPFAETMEHVFRYWGLCTATRVVLGQKTAVEVWDVTAAAEQNCPPKRYAGCCFEVLPSDDYVLACMDLFKDRNLAPEDEVGLYWDFNCSVFRFKLLRKAAAVK
ncbi:unnamed protein product [Cuscuta campestris]|uniref:TF-B3 domain-containing protein n=1 Tax=Cuscuta campestris TaxID=132261 RepID=A0A484KSN7_9ASTE|nr:unnamed protein product [Cuscuta campestris]